MAGGVLAATVDDMMRNRSAAILANRGIEDAADRLAYLVVSYGLLVIVAYRGLVERQASWDLLALVVLGGVVGTIVRFSRGAGGRRWVAVWAASLLIAAVLAVVLATVRT